MTDFDTTLYYQDCVDFLQKLLQIPSVNGGQNEQKIASLVVSEAKKLGLPYRIIEHAKGRPNVFIGENFESSNDLLLVAHMDTVPVGNIKDWNHGPFSGKINNGKIFGRGAIDCKGGIAISLYVLKALNDQGNLSYAKLLCGVDEESGADSVFGIRAAINEGLGAKGAVYTYGGGKDDTLIIGHRGLIRLWITCEGEAAHSGSREWQDRNKGNSAIDGITDFLIKVSGLDLPGNNAYFPGYRNTVTPTLIQGGEGESLVPSRAEVLLDIRTLPDANDRILEQIEELTASLSKGKRKYSIGIKNNIPAVLSDPESKIVNEAALLMKELRGISNPELKGSGPANESYMLVQAGVPTIAGFGPAGRGFHSANEYAELQSIKKSLEFLVKLSHKINN